MEIKVSISNQSGIFDEDLEFRMQEAFEDNIARYLKNLQEHIRSNFYKVQVYFYEDSGYCLDVHVSFTDEKPNKKDEQEFRMLFNYPEKGFSDFEDHFNDYFINDLTLEGIEHFLLDMYTKDEKEICFIGKRSKPFESFKKTYSKLKNSKLFNPNSQFYKYENEVHNFVKIFIDAGFRDIIRQRRMKVFCFYMIGKITQIQVLLNDDFASKAGLFDLETNKLYEVFNENSEYEILDFFVNNSLLLREIVEEYKNVRDLQSLIDFSKLTGY